MERPASPPPAAASATADGADAVTLLTSQHRRLEGQLKALVDSDDGTERATLLSQVGDELAAHLSAEELVFYPAVRAARTEDILLESLEEHLSLKRLLADLLEISPRDETFGAKCKVLDEQARHHHEEEEEHLFPSVRRSMDAAALKQLGRAVQSHEGALHAAGAPRDDVKSQTDAAAPLV